jgi:hypothetical protein
MVTRKNGQNQLITVKNWSKPSKSIRYGSSCKMSAVVVCRLCGCKPKGAALIIGASEAKGQLLRCAGCNITFYCDKACQIKDWPEHKQNCKISTCILQRRNSEKCSELRKVVNKDQVFIKSAKMLLVSLQHEETTWSKRACEQIGRCSNENFENSAKAHLLMLRTLALLSATSVVTANGHVVSCMHNGAENMQTHLSIATTLVQKHGLLGYDEELTELQALIATTNAEIAKFQTSEAYVQIAEGSAFDADELTNFGDVGFKFPSSATWHNAASTFKFWDTAAMPTPPTLLQEDTAPTPPTLGHSEDAPDSAPGIPAMPP